MEIYPNGAGYRPEIEDVPNNLYEENLDEELDEDVEEEYREDLTATSDLNSPTHHAN